MQEPLTKVKVAQSEAEHSKLSAEEQAEWAETASRPRISTTNMFCITL